MGVESAQVFDGEPVGPDVAVGSVPCEGDCGCPAEGNIAPLGTAPCALDVDASVELGESAYSLAFDPAGFATAPIAMWGCQGLKTFFYVERRGTNSRTVFEVKTFDFRLFFKDI